MSRSTIEALRVPVALVLLLVAGFILWPREDTEAEPTAAADAASPSVVVGQPGGAVISTGSPSAAPSAPASATPASTPETTATPEPTEAPTPEPQQDGFTAEVLACQSISGSQCNGQLGTLPAGDGSFTALVRFTDANAGDVMNAVLSGPSGTFPGGAYTLQGGGDGYYYSVFSIGNLAAGDYTLTATRNGGEVATTTFTKAG